MNGEFPNGTFQLDINFKKVTAKERDDVRAGTA